MVLQHKHLNSNNISFFKKIYDDIETKKRIAIDNIDGFYNFVKSRLDYYVWIIYEDLMPIGELSAEIIGYKRVAISYVVDPIKRNQGYCKKILQYMLSIKELAHTDIFEAWVDSDNFPSINCLESSGFNRINQYSDENDLYQ